MTGDQPTFTFDWTPAEHAQVTALLMRDHSSRGLWRVLKWFIALVVVLGGIVALASLWLGDVADAVSLGALVLLVGALSSFFPVLTGRLQAWRVRRSDPNVGSPITHRFDEDGLNIGMRTLDAHLRWSGMVKVRGTPEMFLFYYNERTAYYLPKRAVGSPEDIEGLSRWIRAQLPEGIPTQNLE